MLNGVAFPAVVNSYEGGTSTDGAREDPDFAEPDLLLDVRRASGTLSSACRFNSR